MCSNKSPKDGVYMVNRLILRPFYNCRIFVYIKTKLRLHDIILSTYIISSSLSKKKMQKITCIFYLPSRAFNDNCKNTSA
jgi:hypothetical protein